MDKLDRYLLIALMGSYVVKVAVSGASLADAAIVLVLAGAHVGLKFSSNNAEILELKQQLIDQKAQIDDQKKQIEDVKNAVAGVKITQGLRNIK